MECWATLRGERSALWMPRPGAEYQARYRLFTGRHRQGCFEEVVEFQVDTHSSAIDVSIVVDDGQMSNSPSAPVAASP